jgi:A/G-specific adenine glycosylase
MAQAVVTWQIRHGRNDLPWQGTTDPYRVWLSEIMLQQTQVVTARVYFERFLARFADVRALAAAPLDEVLSLWAGLGYYSRARNLHRCAQEIVRHHDGVFPRTAQMLQTLPGIGRSTAAAIAAICFAERVAILDGNVRRVLTRYLAYDADLARPANERQLWDLATQLLPHQDLPIQMPRYTQGMMDLGATLCTARRPACEVCPLALACQAYCSDQVECFPVRSRQVKRSAQSIWMLWARTDNGALWLQRRPTPGVWAGLFCFSLFDDLSSLKAVLPAAQPIVELPVVKHVLTHKDLFLHPVQVQLEPQARPTPDGEWLDRTQWTGLGLPAPIKKLLTP